MSQVEGIFFDTPTLNMEPNVEPLDDDNSMFQKTFHLYIYIYIYVNIYIYINLFGGIYVKKCSVYQTQKLKHI